MAVIKLSDGYTDITFEGVKYYRQPDILKVSKHRSMDGTLHVRKWYKRGRWEIGLTLIPKATADVINGWWENTTSLTFYPDLVNTPTESFTVKLVNSARPLNAMTGKQFGEYYDGELQIEVS